MDIETITILEDATMELSKAIALVSLIQSATDDYVTVEGPFKAGFEMLATNLSTVYGLLYDLNTNLTDTIQAATK